MISGVENFSENTFFTSPDIMVIDLTSGKSLLTSPRQAVAFSQHLTL